jgi:hypothetical protein
MPVPINHVHDLRAGAKEARTVNLHRLRVFLEKVADLGQAVRGGADLDVELIAPDVVAAGAAVARDLCRSTAGGSLDSPAA